MDVGLNNYLKRLSSELFIKYDSLERRKIDASVISITNGLEKYFGDEVDDALLFGSYTRDTILPRKYDVNSDIDILIQFNSEKYDKLKPESYRNKLKRFAELKYPNSLIVKDHPSVVLVLNHINFDLVPAIFDEGFFYNSIEIPNKDGGWMETEPEKFNKKLISANTQFNSIVKPIVRLLKAWNARNDYPYPSYEIETLIAEMNFSNDNYESGFLYAIEKLPTYSLPMGAEKKVDTLRKNAEWIKVYLDRQNIEKAKEVVERIIKY